MDGNQPRNDMELHCYCIDLVEKYIPRTHLEVRHRLAFSSGVAEILSEKNINALKTSRDERSESKLQNIYLYFRRIAIALLRQFPHLFLVYCVLLVQSSIQALGCFLSII